MWEFCQFPKSVKSVGGGRCRVEECGVGRCRVEECGAGVLPVSQGSATKAPPLCPPPLLALQIDIIVAPIPSQVGVLRHGQLDASNTNVPGGRQPDTGSGNEWELNQPLDIL